jgi:hypothetical protein
MGKIISSSGSRKKEILTEPKSTLVIQAMISTYVTLYVTSASVRSHGAALRVSVMICPFQVVQPLMDAMGVCGKLLIKNLPLLEYSFHGERGVLKKTDQIDTRVSYWSE